MARHHGSGVRDAERHSTNWSQDKRITGHVSLHEPTREHQGRPKGADAEGTEVGFEMDARKPTEGVAIATSREGDAAAAQKPRGAPAAGT